MRTYPEENWKRLGEWVHDARVQAGLSDTTKWAARVGRSTRVLLGLERGEPVGAKTIEAVAEALGVANWAVFQVLTHGDATSDPWRQPDVEEARATYEEETGLLAHRQVSALDSFSDEELAEEVLRRMRRTPRASLPPIGWGPDPAPGRLDLLTDDPYDLAAADDVDHPAGEPEDDTP